MAELKVGTKLQCVSCGSQVVVIRAPAATPECCGAAMQAPEASP